MEAYSLLKFCRVTARNDATGVHVRGSDACRSSTTSSSETSTTNVEPDDETDGKESFFDLEFAVHRYDDKEQNDSTDLDINSSDSDEDSFSDLVKKDGETRSGSRLDSSSNPQSPISFLRSPPKFPVFMLFKKSKLEKTESADASPATPSSRLQSKRFTVQCKVEEIPVISFLARVNSSRSNLPKQSPKNDSSKRSAKDVAQKYLKLINPLYVRVPKMYGENQDFSDEIPSGNPSPPTAPLRKPRKQVEEKKRGSIAAPLLVVCKHLGTRRSSSSGSGIMPSPTRKRDDSIQQQDDWIQGAILHCKTSYKSSREISALSRSVSEPSREISVHPKKSSEEEKRRSSI